MVQKPHRKDKKIRVWAVCLWLLLWQFFSMIIGQEILLVSPITVLKTLVKLILESATWISIATSLARILQGFLLAQLLAIGCAAAAARFFRFREFLEPFITTIKSVPVASFVILILIWVSSARLSVIISFLMVFPVLYENIRQGIQQCDQKLLEMAQVYKIKPATAIRYIYIPEVLPYFQTACSLSLGLCWKAGIAAEVIGLPRFSIGENLYNAKIYLATGDLFAWTVMIIGISILFEKLFMEMIGYFVKQIEQEE